MDANSLSDQYIHLTNNAIQKTSDKYDRAHGAGKWSLRSLKLYMASKHGLGAPLPPLLGFAWLSRPVGRSAARRCRRHTCCDRFPISSVHDSAEVVNDLFTEIQHIVTNSLLSVQRIIINDKHCFELYAAICIRVPLTALGTREYLGPHHRWTARVLLTTACQPIPPFQTQSVPLPHGS
jgi:tubulin polyglutamylase TTLL9